MSWGVLPWVYPVWDSLGFLDCVTISFPILGKCSTIVSSSIFSWPFVLPSSSGMLMIQLLGHLPLSQSSLRLSLFLLILLSSLIHFYHSIFYLTNPTFCLLYSTICCLQNKENSTNCQNTERPPQTQQYKREEKAEKYPAGKGTG